MAFIVANRAKFTLAGGASSTWAVGQANLTSISIHDSTQTVPFSALMYQPVPAGFLFTQRGIRLLFQYFFTDETDFIDFSLLPSNYTNVQARVYTQTNKLIANLSGVTIDTSNVDYAGQSRPGVRSIVFNATDITYGNFS